jgi:hypothetical protein
MPREEGAYATAVLLLEGEDGQQASGLAALPGTHALALLALGLLLLRSLGLGLLLGLLVVACMDVRQNPACRVRVVCRVHAREEPEER